jgi:hypothetical protein
MDYPEHGAAMEHAIQLQSSDLGSLYLASSVFHDVNETLRDVHTIVAVLLRYAEIGASIANHLIERSTTPAPHEI